MTSMETRHEGRLYDEDFYAWTQQQADILRRGRLLNADIEGTKGGSMPIENKGTGRGD